MKTFGKAILGLGLVLLLAAVLPAQEPYKVPPREIVDILDAPPTPRVSMSPAGGTMLLVDYQTMPSIEELAKPLLRIAGMRITPATNSRQMLTYSTGLTFKTLPAGAERKVDLPAGIRFGSPSWSNDGKQLAFPRYLDDGIELWVVDVKTAAARALPTPPLNAVLGGGLNWLPDNRTLLVSTVPAGRGAPPPTPRFPDGPNIQQTAGKFAQVWTYQDLLQSPYDIALFDYYAASQPGLVDTAAGTFTKVGAPGVYAFVDPSPEGNFFLVRRVKKPYSYSVPYSSFPSAVELWDRAGTIVKVLADLPIADEIPPNGVMKGPRSHSWQPLKPATLLWVEALDEGDPKNDVPFRDQVYALTAPFTGAPGEVAKTKHRYAGFTWLGRTGLAFLTESDWERRWRTTYLLDTENPAAGLRTVFDLSSQDSYNDPGRPVTETTLAGERIAVQDKDTIYLSGSGASPQGDRPFLDRLDLKTLKTTRLYQCGEGGYETFVDFAGPDRRAIITSYETATQPPNYYLVDLRSKKRTALTSFADPAPQLTGMKKQLVKYQREDGVPLSGTLYLPPDHVEGTRLPVVIWAYPLEYSSADTAGQVRGSAHRFTFFRGTSQLFFVTQGYAVFDNATMPVIGDPKTMNDTFVKQIVMNAQAAIDVLDQMGVGDPKRVGVGGHSYGAFMTANLLARCDLFAAGIARSGAYNRTLTPFGFQSERRNFWEAPDTYFNLSPFMHANKINEPILLIHGEADNNTGTYPIQSQRMYAALQGFGATARLVMLPHESHGYSGRESVFHVLAEMIEWFDTHVKNRK